MCDWFASYPALRGRERIQELSQLDKLMTKSTRIFGVEAFQAWPNACETIAI